MALRQGSIETKNKILSVCVRLFLERGYKNTPISMIIEEAGVSVSTFQNIFHTKDGVLAELIEFMFSNQFAMAEKISENALSPIYVYAVETAIQLALTELNENLRDIYCEAYSVEQTAEYIYENTAIKLYRIFGSYLKGRTEADFYNIEIGTAGIMRGYMSKKCDIHFPLKKKIECFLTSSLRVFAVPESEIKNVMGYIGGIDIVPFANGVMQKLFAALEMRFDFTL